MSRPLGVLLSVCSGVLILSLASVGRAQDVDPGERLMNAACLECHSIRAIQTQAMGADAWTTRVSQEIERGAKLSKDDAPTLVAYLTRTHGPLPDGPGKDVLLHTCTMCHELFRIKFGRRSPEEWEETLVSMLNEGAQLSDDEFNRVLRYLSINFGVD